MSMSTSIVNNKKITRSWIVFDWANSAYSLVVVSAIFPQVFNSFASENTVFLGVDFKSAEALYTISICFSFLIIAIISPVLSGIADYSGRKKIFMQIFTTIGSLSCMGLYFFSPEKIWIGVVGAILASIGYSGSMVFYNAFLPEIATTDKQDDLSARGFAYGYLGSSLLLIALLVMVANFDVLGFTSELAVFMFGFVLVGIWWLGWSQWTFKFLPNKSNKIDSSSKLNTSVVKQGFLELKKVWDSLAGQTQLKQFLKAFFAIDLGLQTLIIVAPLFAQNMVKMEGSELIVVIIIMQFLGIVGAVLFSKISKTKGNVWSLIVATIIYLVICTLAILFTDKSVFYCLAGLMGLAIGGIQSQARSTYSKLLPELEHTASYFSFYDVLEKLAIVLGTLLYALVAFVFADNSVLAAPKIGMLVLAFFFLIGLILWFPLLKSEKLKEYDK